MRAPTASAAAVCAPVIALGPPARRGSADHIAAGEAGQPAPPARSPPSTTHIELGHDQARLRAAIRVAPLGRGDRSGSRRTPGSHRPPGARPRRHPRPEPRRPPSQDQEIARPGRPRREPRRPPRAAQRLLPLRRRLPRRRREAPRRPTRRALSHGLLPAALAVRGRVGGGLRLRDTCVQTSPKTTNSRSPGWRTASKQRLRTPAITQEAGGVHLALISPPPSPSEARLRAAIRVAPLPATRPSPWVASHRRCRSWAGRRRPPSQGYVCPDKPETAESGLWSGKSPSNLGFPTSRSSKKPATIALRLFGATDNGLKLCDSGGTSPQSPSQGYVCPDKPENHKFEVAGLANRLQAAPSRPPGSPKTPSTITSHPFGPPWPSEARPPSTFRLAPLSSTSQLWAAPLPASVAHEVPQCIASPQLFGWNVFSSSWSAPGSLYG